MKPYFITASFIVIFVLILPAAIAYPFSGKKAVTPPAKPVAVTKTTAPMPIDVSVYRSAQKKVQSVPLQQYVIGVVASEMPATFQMEALKAQALAARTYIVHYLIHSPNQNIPKGAEVTDTVMNQVYKDDNQLKSIWGNQYNWKIAKITKAVKATKGQIITYKGQPITAAFFSTSNGYTESAKAYWGHNIPYLQSVPSPWDRNSPKFLSHEKLPLKKVDDKLGIHIQKTGSIDDVLKTTPGHRVGEVKIAGKTFSGRQVREDLGLRSTDFTMKREGNQILITTKGFGHGVGMSQFGANEMAKHGKNDKQIIKYYYRGVSISNIGPYTAKLTAKS